MIITMKVIKMIKNCEVLLNLPLSLKFRYCVYFNNDKKCNRYLRNVTRFCPEFVS